MVIYYIIINLSLYTNTIPYNITTVYTLRGDHRVESTPLTVSTETEHEIEVQQGSMQVLVAQQCKLHLLGNSGS